MVAASAARTVAGIIELVIFASWGLFFAVMIGMLVTVVLLRGARERAMLRRGASVPAGPDPRLPAQLAEIRRGDPAFDEQLLLEAAQMACLLMFAATSTGDEEPVRHIAAPSFWATFFGRYIATSARDIRLRHTPDSTTRASAYLPRLPIDYQATAPELIGLELGGIELAGRQFARVRVSFSQLCVIVAPGAARQAAAASAKSLTSLAAGIGGAMGSRMNNEPSDVSWVSWAGRYDLDFTRAAGSRTDPGAALASRTCMRCGAGFASELATACGHCHTPRPVAWGDWRLAEVTAVDD
jgi:hypothetical protein